MLPDREALSVIRAIFAYEQGEAVPELDGAAKMAFSFISSQLDRDNAKWEDIREKRRLAGQSGGRATQDKNRAARESANLSKQTEQEADLLKQNEANQAVPVPVPEINITSSETDEGGERKQKKAAPFPHDGNPYKAAAMLSRCVKERYPKIKPHTERDLQRWAEAIDKCNRIDGHEWDLISDVLTFSQSDPFWRKNIRSGDTFRKQFESLYAKMIEEGGRTHD